MMFKFDLGTYNLMAMVMIIVLSLVDIISAVKYKQYKYLYILMAANIFQIINNGLFMVRSREYNFFERIVYNMSECVSIYLYIFAILLVLRIKIKLVKPVITLWVVSVIFFIVSDDGMQINDIQRSFISFLIIVMIVIALLELNRLKTKKNLKFYRTSAGLLIIFMIYQVTRIVLNFMGHQANFATLEQRIAFYSVATIAFTFFFNIFVMLLSIDFLNLKVLELSVRDGLTKLYNRSFFIELLENYIAGEKRNKTKFLLVLIDIDDFKKVNDTYGHLAGDEVLQKFAKHMVDNVRESDNIGRYGGEEFVILLKDASLSEAKNVLNRLLISVPEIKFEKMDKGITFSAGAAEFEVTDEKLTVEQMIKEIDDKLYKAKENGKNQIVYEIS